jgi:Lon protease-like protein
MPSEGRLPLFPLQVVLFPCFLLPLHIFEERYKLLIDECVTDTKEFGINLVQGNKLFDVGCTAAVVSVQRTYDDGSKDIVVRGMRRYMLQQHDTQSAAYSIGRVAYLKDTKEQVDQKLVTQTVELFDELISVVYRDKAKRSVYDLAAENISFVLAQKAGIDLLQRQHLLERSSENERLQFLLAHLKDVIPKLEKLEERERIVRCDGYL